MKTTLKWQHTRYCRRLFSEFEDKALETIPNETERKFTTDYLKFLRRKRWTYWNEMSSNVLEDVREVGKILKGKQDRGLGKKIDKMIAKSIQDYAKFV